MRAAFDRAASGYDAAAVLQAEVRRRMLERLDYIKLAPDVILDAGAGTGHAASALAARYPESQVVLLDLAPGMLRVAGGALGRVCGDMERLPLAAGSVDLIWSNLVLQWCNDVAGVFSGMARVLRPEGLFMFSTFGPDTLKELREAAQADPEHVHVSRFPDMHDLGDALVHAGFSGPVLDVERFVLTYQDVREVMRDLKDIGAGNALQGRPRGLEGKGFLRGLAARYECFRTAGKLPATFEVVYGHAWKGGASVALPDGAHPVMLHRRR